MGSSPPKGSGSPRPGDRTGLGATERAVLAVLLAEAGKVVGRDSILRLAQLRHCTPRRCDAAIVAIRRALGPGAVVTVRGRGWRLADAATTSAAALLQIPV